MTRDVDGCHERDKRGLFRLAGLVVIVLGCMVVGPFYAGHLPEKSDVLLGGIATGLIMFLRDIVAAVRAGWEEVTRSKTNDQLAKGAPPALPLDGEPVPVRVEQPDGEPVPVKESKP